MTREEHIIYAKNLRTALNMANNFSAETMESLDAAIKALEQEPKTIQEKQADSEKYQKAFDDGYDNGYAQARFDYEQEPQIRPKGHWIEVWDKEHLVILAYQCSECKTMRNQKTNYCADCGAEMESRE